MPWKGLRLRILPGRVHYARGVQCPACQMPIGTSQIITVWNGRKLIMLAEVCSNCEYLISRIFPNKCGNRKLMDILTSTKYLTELYNSLYSNAERGST